MDNKNGGHRSSVTIIAFLAVLLLAAVIAVCLVNRNRHRELVESVGVQTPGLAPSLSQRELNRRFVEFGKRDRLSEGFVQQCVVDKEVLPDTQWLYRLSGNDQLVDVVFDMT